MQFKRLLLSLLFFWVELVSHAKSLKIERITPSGDQVSELRQIVVQFSNPMVALGELDGSNTGQKISITPVTNCNWQWLNPNTLACQLDNINQLKLATTYRITAAAGISDLSGQTLQQAYRHEFVTELPKLTYSYLFGWRSPTEPIFITNFSQPVSKKSVSKVLTLLAKDKKYPIQVDINPNDRRKTRYVWNSATQNFDDLGFDEYLKEGETHKDYSEDIARDEWLIYSTTALPAATLVEISEEDGLRSAFGSTLSREKKIHGSYFTFGEHRFLGFQCTGINDELIRRLPNEDPSPPCDPQHGVKLCFASGVEESAAKTLQITPPFGKKDDQAHDPWETVYNSSFESSQVDPQNPCYLSLPMPMRAATQYRIQGQPEDFFGRKLDKPIDLTIYTSHRRPAFKFVHEVGILEKHAKSDVPVYLTNIDSFSAHYKTLTSQGVETDKNYFTKAYPVKDISYAFPLGIREQLKGQSGLVIGEIKTEPSIAKKSIKNEFIAQITPWQMIVKLGHFNSLVWVSDMQTGEPVTSAKVQIYLDNYDKLSGPQNILASAETNSDGLAILKGAAGIDPSLEHFRYWYSKESPRFFVHISKGDDIALMPLDDQFRVDVYRLSQDFGSQLLPKDSHLKAWGMTPQGIYKASERMEFKLYVRQNTDRSLSLPDRKGYTLLIKDPKGKEVFRKSDLSLSEFGTIEGEYEIPKTATVGYYQFELHYAPSKITLYPLNVLVTDFTPSPFKVSQVIAGSLFKANDKIHVETKATLHSGGPFADAKARISASFMAKYFQSQHPLTKGLYFSVNDSNETASAGFFSEEKILDDKGQTETTITLNQLPIVYGKILIESAVQTDRGSYIANSKLIDYRGLDRFVGLKLTEWIFHVEDEVGVEALVVNESGKPVSDVPISITLQREDVKVARTKGAGNAFVNRYVREWVNVGHCDVNSQTEKLVLCQIKPNLPGSYRIIAQIKDTQDRIHATTIHTWVEGNKNVVWPSDNDYKLEIVSETNEWKVGDKARFLVQNPFPNASALITLERFGVLEHWTQKLETSTSVIEFPIKPEHIPGFYLSVTVVSPRVSEPSDPLKLDLGKPAFRMGYVKARVKDDFYRINITTQTDKKEYKPGQKVTVNLQAKGNFNTQEVPVSFALVALDEAVFDLIPKGIEQYDAYRGFYQLDPLDLENYALLIKLIGQQKFEKKGANPGGDGGIDVDVARKLFKFVAYWQPTAIADSNGKLSFSFDLPDNLTGWKILSLAATADGFFGLGEANIKVNQNLEIRPELPNQLAPSDTFEANFSLLNRTDSNRNVEVKIQIEGAELLEKGSLYETKVTIPPYKREMIRLPMQVSANEGFVQFSVTATSDLDRDALIHKLTIREPKLRMDAITSGLLDDSPHKEAISVPKEGKPDSSFLQLKLSGSLLGQVEPVMEMAKNYPYSCWEQKLSQSIAASSFLDLSAQGLIDFEWNEADRLLQETLASAQEFQAPNGGMAYFVASDEFASPYLSAYTAWAFHLLAQRKVNLPELVVNKLDEYLLKLLRDDKFPLGYDKAQLVSVRSLILFVLAQKGKLNFTDWARFEPYFSNMDTAAKIFFAHAGLSVSQVSHKSYLDKILGLSEQTPSSFNMIESHSSSWQLLHSSTLRSDCVALSYFIDLAQKDFNEIKQPLLKLMQQVNRSWSFLNTHESSFCLAASVRFSNELETKNINKTVTAQFASETPQLFTLQHKKDRKKQIIAQGFKDGSLTLSAKGEGNVFYQLTNSYQRERNSLTKDENQGFALHKELSVWQNGSWQLVDKNTTLERGALVRTDLFISTGGKRFFVVVDDPAAGALEPINQELAHSIQLTPEQKLYQPQKNSRFYGKTNWQEPYFSPASFYFKEIRQDGVRFFADFLEAGDYHLSYYSQIVASGRFWQPQTKIFEMYQPEVFGLSGGFYLGR